MSGSTATVFGRDVLPETLPDQAPYWRIALRGLSQLSFQTNEVTGVLLMVAVVTFDWRMALLAVIGVFVGTAVVLALKPPRFLSELGIFGFNSALIGLSFGWFYDFNFAVVVAVVVMSAVAAALTVFGDRYVPFPVLAVPFIFSFWAFWEIAEKVGIHKTAMPPFGDDTVQPILAGIVACGGALFSGSLVAGVIFLVAVAINNWRIAGVAFIGAVVAHEFVMWWEVPGQAITTGFVGFNAVLCSIAIYELMAKDFRLVIMGAVGSTILMGLVMETGMVALASGFVLMFWVMLILEWFAKVYNAQAEVPDDISESV